MRSEIQDFDSDGGTRKPEASGDNGGEVSGNDGTTESASDGGEQGKRGTKRKFGQISNGGKQKRRPVQKTTDG